LAAPKSRDPFVEEFFRYLTVERNAFAVRVLCYVAFGTILAACNIVFDYAKKVLEMTDSDSQEIRALAGKIASVAGHDQRRNGQVTGGEIGHR
jgi:hypothetical protein